MSSSTVFVCGATGTQGGVVARHLIAQGATIHATVRDLNSTSAQALASLGVKLWAGTWASEEAIRSAMAGCTAAFLNFSPDFTDLSAELGWAKSILSIAKEAGVQHVVYSSGFAVSEPERLKNWDASSFVGHVLLSKQAIEKATREAGIPHWTIFRPGSFMANYLDPLVRMYAGFVEQGTWTTALRPDSAMPLVDTETIGVFVSEALKDPARYSGQALEFADELMLPDQIVAKLAAATGRDLKIVYLSDEEVEAQKGTNPFINGQLTARDMAQFLDMEKVKSMGVPLGSFEGFLEREKARVNETWN